MTAAKPTTPRRASTADRQEQIANVTLRLISKYGVSGVSLARIADEIGVTDAALYKHFSGKSDILVAAFDVLAARVFRWIESAPGSNVIEQLTAMGESHSRLFSRDIRGFNTPMFQFSVWIPRDRVHSHVDETHRAMMGALGDLIGRGKAQGCVRPDVDVDVVVSQIYAWIWWEDLSYLRGLDAALIAKESKEMLGRILTDISIDRQE